MTALTEKLPMIPRIHAHGMDPALVVRPYSHWQLLECDPASGEILICKPCPAHDRTRSQHLIILAGAAAAAWLSHQRAAPV